MARVSASWVRLVSLMARMSASYVCQVSLMTRVSAKAGGMRRSSSSIRLSRVIPNQNK